MNRKQFTLLLVLGLVVGGVGLYLTSRNRATYGQTGQAMGGRVLPEFAMNDVAQIQIREGTNELNLVKVEERWRVQERDGYPADYGNISGLLRKVWELKVVQSEEAGASQWPRLQMAEPGQGTNSGVLLQFKSAEGKDLGALVLGKKHMRQGADTAQFGGGWPDGRYLRVPGEDRVALVSEAFTEVEAKPERFLNKDFIKVEKLRSIRVTHPEAEKSWAVERETESGPWKLIDAGEGESLDTTKTSSFNYLLSNPMFDDVMTREKAGAAAGLDEAIVARLETFEGFEYEVKVGAKTDDEKYYVAVGVEGRFERERVAGAEESEEDKARLDGEFKDKLGKLEEKQRRESEHSRWVYLVSKWTVDGLLKTRGELLESKAEQDAGADTEAGEHLHLEDEDDAGLVPEFFK